MTRPGGRPATQVPSGTMTAVPRYRRSAAGMCDTGAATTVAPASRTRSSSEV
jgi:hypothetical protein